MAHGVFGPLFSAQFEAGKCDSTAAEKFAARAYRLPSVDLVKRSDPDEDGVEKVEVYASGYAEPRTFRMELELLFDEVCS